MSVKLIYITTALVLLLFVLSAALLALLVMSDDENHALRSELEDTKQLLGSTQEELYDKVELVREKDLLIAQQESNITALSADLHNKRDQVKSLQQQLDQSQADLERAESTLQEAEEEISALKEETLDMEQRINDSIAWFSDNAELPSTLKTDRFISEVEDGCVDGDTLKLGCVSYLMDTELGFQYKFDPGGDTLYSIDDIIQRKGGDCEDYALFFKAFLNRFDGMELEAWEPGSGRYELYTDYDTSTIWYYDDTDPKRLDGKGLNPYAACYYYGYYEGVQIGHCIIMMAERDIRSPEDITPEALWDAQFFEPQTGEYFGRMGADFGVCVDGQQGCGESFGNLVFIITDRDLFEFSDGKWNYYGGYLERSEAILQELESIAT